ncbi:hypothetical protein KEM52_005131 [Ascosphaera acerosa]|nr:hypothetical protein KEM52_005131 [Ascosphaera acerosa]
MAQPNIFILASDNSPALLPLLRQNPALASSQDEHGYSLLHAAASWGHADLLRALVREFHVDLRLADEDGDTCLFTAETVEVARCLVEELGMDASVRNDAGMTAAEAIAEEGTFPEVAAYLAGQSTAQSNGNGAATTTTTTTTTTVPSGASNGEVTTSTLPPNMQINFSAVSEQALGGAEPDPELRRRIEQLAQSDRFSTPEGQAELRELVQQALGRATGGDGNLVPDQPQAKRREAE